ncbi:twitching motility protein PilT [Cytophagales bacterium WSM2-2]|nr:twitching motility protein PilT [Cytophagales bacterium WSM2-2]
MKVFLDANILVSVLNKEYPQFTYSARVMSLVDDNRFEIFTSPICLAIAFYFAEKKSGRKEAKNKIRILVSKINIAEADQGVIQKAVQDKSVGDFEDGMEYYSALKAGCKWIVTEDKNDFHFSKVPVMTAREFLEEHVL